MSTRSVPPKAAEDEAPAPVPAEERGTNAVEPEPDPNAEPLPQGERKYVPRSPYTPGNV